MREHYDFDKMKGEKNPYKDKALHFWDLARAYMKLVSNAAQMNVENGNSDIAIWDANDANADSHETCENEIDRQTKWSAPNIIIPLLFNFYHRLELMLKGFLIVHPNGTAQAHHRLEELCNEFKRLFPEETQIHFILQKYTQRDCDDMPSIIRDFLEENNTSVEKFYEAFRYPADRNLGSFHNYYNLKYEELGDTSFCENLVQDIKELLTESVRLSSFRCGKIFVDKTINKWPTPCKQNVTLITTRSRP